MSVTIQDNAPSLSEVEQAMESFSAISADLLTSYNALEVRATRVEEELAVTNRALEAKVAELDAVLEALPVGVAVRDADGFVCRVNGNLARTLDVQATDLIGKRDIAMLTKARSQNGRVITAKGKPLKLDMRRSKVRLAGNTETPFGSIVGSVEIVDDRSEIESLTERVHAMDKVAALGTMAGGIAHEIRNPLNAVAGFADLLESRLATSDDEKAVRWSSLISQGAAEANAIITSLMSLATPSGLERQAIEATGLIEDALAAAGDEVTGAVVHVHVDCPAFVGDHIKLRQALRNLIANAANAKPGGDLVIRAELAAGEIALTVADAGPGIAPELRARVLDPFFTTRAEGCGLGLALTNTIADLHGGRLEISASPSELGGAQVSLHLPFVQLR